MIMYLHTSAIAAWMKIVSWSHFPPGEGDESPATWVELWVLSTANSLWTQQWHIDTLQRFNVNVNLLANRLFTHPVNMDIISNPNIYPPYICLFGHNQLLRKDGYLKDVYLTNKCFLLNTWTCCVLKRYREGIQKQKVGTKKIRNNEQNKCKRG